MLSQAARLHSLYPYMIFVVVVQLLSHVQLFATPWTAARQACLSFTLTRSLLKLMSIESVTPSNHLILCRPFASCPQSFEVFSNESAVRIRWPKYWSFSFNISPTNEHPGLISFIFFYYFLFFLPFLFFLNFILFLNFTILY